MPFALTAMTLWGLWTLVAIWIKFYNHFSYSHCFVFLCHSSIQLCHMAVVTLDMLSREELLVSSAWTDWPCFCAMRCLTAAWSLVLFVVLNWACWSCGCCCSGSCGCWLLQTAAAKKMARVVTLEENTLPGGSFAGGGFLHLCAEQFLLVEGLFTSLRLGSGNHHLPDTDHNEAQCHQFIWYAFHRGVPRQVSNDSLHGFHGLLVEGVIWNFVSIKVVHYG